MKEVLKKVPKSAFIALWAAAGIWAVGLLIFFFCLSMSSKSIALAKRNAEALAALEPDFADAETYDAAVAAVMCAGGADISVICGEIKESGGTIENLPVSGVNASMLERIRFRAGWPSVRPSILSELICHAESAVPPIRVSSIEITTRKKSFEKDAPVEASIIFEVLRRKAP